VNARVVRLSRLIEGAGIEIRGATGSDPEIADLFLDSRQVTPGALFSAIRGLRADGASFVPEALRRGALAILSEDPRPDDLDPAVAWLQVEDARRATALLAREWHDRPDEALTLVGVTGTNGKTSRLGGTGVVDGENDPRGARPLSPVARHDG